MGAVTSILGAPLRAVVGALGGAHDGIYGQVDTNERFPDGAYGQNTDKMSRAGHILSRYAGARGGAEMGEKFGTGGMALGAAYATGHFLVTNVLVGGMALGFGFPVIPALAITAVAACLGGALGQQVGKYAGAVIGMAVGAVGGAAVGAFNAVFKRGFYADPPKDRSIPKVERPAPVSKSHVPGGETKGVLQDVQVTPGNFASQVTARRDAQLQANRAPNRTPVRA